MISAALFEKSAQKCGQSYLPLINPSLAALALCVSKLSPARLYKLSALALLTSRCYACDILRSLRALPLTTGRNAWAWHDSLRSNMYHAFPAHCSVAHCVAPRCPLYNEITHARHNANKFAFYSRLIVIFAFSDELPLRCTTQAKVILKKKPAP